MKQTPSNRVPGLAESRDAEVTALREAIAECRRELIPLRDQADANGERWARDMSDLAAALREQDRLRDTLADARSTIAAQAATIADLHGIFDRDIDETVQLRRDLAFAREQLAHRDALIELMRAALPAPEPPRTITFSAPAAVSSGWCQECSARPGEAHYAGCAYSVPGEVRS